MNVQRDFGPDRYHEIPPHGRWQHFNVGNIDRISRMLLRTKETADPKEQTRVLIDLFMVSVLLDAGAGDSWSFQEPNTGNQNVYNRSEGIAVASLYMFESGAFSSSPACPCTVDGRALLDLDEERFLSWFQISNSNPMVGVHARIQLLRDVGKSLLSLPDIFGSQGRPGNLVDYMTASVTGTDALDYTVLWSALQRLLLPAWPKDRTHLGSQPLGDAWPLQVLARQSQSDANDTPAKAIQPFHKLTQWLAYSLTTPFVKILHARWENMELGTGLPEYRNGGLFVDMGVLSLKEDTLSVGQRASGQILPIYDATSDVIVEWRAMTVALLDRLHEIISKEFAAQGIAISMAQMLEAGSWKTGRELAATKRPKSRSSPILIAGDGTLF
ncbi:Protein urg3 [Fonsecaea pedrosoi]|nr:Protein urg3 [Fonsecaea pedrosoi]